MRLAALCVAASFTLLATGCGGGGGGGGGGSALPSTGVASGQTPATGQSIHATAQLVIPNAVSSQARGARYVSASTNGVSVTAYAHSDTNHATPLGSAVTDVSSTSTACTPVSGAGRSCTVNVQGPLGSDDFVFNLYDTKPAGGAIPNTAHLLGNAVVTSTLTANMANSVNATIGGVITGLSGATPFISTPADGATHNIGITITASDFGNNTITGAGTVGTYANPVTVAVTEHGGTGHATVSLNGGAGAASVQASKSNDRVQVVYDGKGSSGYYITVALTAAAIGGSTAPTPESATISPLIVTSTSTDYTQASSSIGLHGNGDLPAFTVSEAQATPTFTFTRGTHCPAVALLEKLTATTFNVLALGNTSSYVAGAGCAMTVSDGTSTVTLGVSNSYTHTFSGSPTVTDFAVPTAGGALRIINVGTDGQMWFSECGVTKVAKIPTNATSASQIQEYPVTSAYGIVEPETVAPGPDGNMWWTDCYSSTVGRMSSSGVVISSVQVTGKTYGLVAGPDGNMWFGECNSPYDVGNVSATGTINHYAPAAHSYEWNVTEGPDGNLWYILPSADQVLKVTTGGAMTIYPLPTGSKPQGIVAGPDGNIWFTECRSGFVAKINPSTGVITPYSTTTTVAPDQITVGADGALWYTTYAANLYRITTSGTISGPYAVPHNVTNGIASGPDGNIWFTECTNPGYVGKMTI